GRHLLQRRAHHPDVRQPRRQRDLRDPARSLRQAARESEARRHGREGGRGGSGGREGGSARGKNQREEEEYSSGWVSEVSTENRLTQRRKDAKKRRTRHALLRPLRLCGFA